MKYEDKVKYIRQETQRYMRIIDGMIKEHDRKGGPWPWDMLRYKKAYKK